MILDELGAYLQTQGVGTLGTDLFTGTLPDVPDNAVALYEYGGVSPVSTLGATNMKFERPRIQVLARATTYSAARSKIEMIFKLLHGLANTSLSSVRYLLVEAVQSPFFMERDANNRVKLICNFQIHKEPSP